MPLYEVKGGAFYEVKSDWLYFGGIFGRFLGRKFGKFGRIFGKVFGKFGRNSAVKNSRNRTAEEDKKDSKRQYKRKDNKIKT